MASLQQDFVRIAISRADGGLSIKQFFTLIKRNADDPGIVNEPTPENIQADIDKSPLYAGSTWRIIDDAEIPQDRTFRNAWIDTGKIDHDMDKARAIHMDRIRKVRDAKLAETDKQLAALDGGPVPQALRAQRQALRDLPQTTDLSKAETVEQLKAIWPAELSK